jgi:PelA/Pel-15E family pectate lyase
MLVPRMTVHALAAAAIAAAGCVHAQSRIPAADSSDYLAERRLAALSPSEAARWREYLERSRRLHEADLAAMRAELAAVGRDRMVRAPYASGFRVEDRMTPSWFATDSARRIADNLLSFQTPSGGWSKRTDMISRPRQKGESYFSETDRWSWIPTIDNGATTEQLSFLIRAHDARPDARYADAIRRGFEYLLAAQLPSGCWPQVFPLEGGYHDAATFNDDATTNVLALLLDARDGRPSLLDTLERARAGRAVGTALDCIVRAQVVVNGRRTAWGQQHDPLTLIPVGARSYEHPSLASRESAHLVDLLLRLPRPDSAMQHAIHAAADWFRASAIHGFAYDLQAGLRAEAGAGPLWARMYEIETGRPLFSNRDGVRLYDWDQLTDRRQGYMWFTDEPAATLRRYERWAKRFPRQGTAVRKDP